MAAGSRPVHRDTLSQFPTILIADGNHKFSLSRATRDLISTWTAHRAVRHGCGGRDGRRAGVAGLLPAPKTFNSVLTASDIEYPNRQKILARRRQYFTLVW